MSHFTQRIVRICLTVLFTATGLLAGEIHDAIDVGDLKKVRELLEADPGLLESKDKGGNTPLNKACFNHRTWDRHSEIARFLIDKGANVNTKSNIGTTPLIGACLGSGPDFALVQQLIARGAEINVKDNHGHSALGLAIGLGNIDIAKFMIENGADPGSFTLHGAISYREKDSMAKLLLENGVKFNKKDANGNTELHLAAMRGFSDLAQLLVKRGADIYAVNDNNHTALYYAAQYGYRRTAEALIAAEADKNTIGETNYGNAPQLSTSLKQGEAYLWYVSDGYVMKTKENLLLFGWRKINDSMEAGLANGNINPDELNGQKITVFTHYPKRGFRGPLKSWLLGFTKRLPDADWTFFGEPTENNPINEILKSYRVIGANKNLSVGKIQVHTIAAMERGFMAYLIEVDGVKIFFGGEHVPTNKASEMEKYRQEIDSLKPFGPIDIAILRVRGHFANVYEPYLYLIDQLSPKAVYLMGGNGNGGEHEYQKCAKLLQTRNVSVKHPEGSLVKVGGERFYYLSPNTQEFTDLYGDYLGQTPPGDTPVVFAPGIVSTIYMEHSALAFSTDGNEVFWRVAKGFISTPDLLVVPKTMKRIGDRWTVPMDSPYGGSPFFSPDGKRLYFSHLLPDGKADGPYLVEKHGNSWSEPKNIGLVARFPELKAVRTPSVTHNGTLYFAGDIAGLGMIKDHVLYRSKLLNDEYTKLELLPRCINLPLSWNYTPFIAPDESYLIFSSNRPGSLDQHGDLYISFYDIRSDTWSEPVNMGEPINTRGQESSPGLSPDGKYLFYTGPVAGRQADVFWVSAGIIEKLKAKVVQKQRLKANSQQEKSKMKKTHKKKGK